MCHVLLSRIGGKLGRESLEEKLDLFLKGEDSYVRLLEKESSERRNEKKNRARKKLELKKAFKETLSTD